MSLTVVDKMAKFNIDSIDFGWSIIEDPLER